MKTQNKRYLKMDKTKNSMTSKFQDAITGIYLFTVLSSIVLLALLFILPMISASDLSGLPAQKQGSTVFIIQSCDNSTYSNISSILLGSTVIKGVTVMPQISEDYYVYNLTATSKIGTYIVNGYCDEFGAKTNWAYSFVVNPTGQENNPQFFWFVLILSLGVVVLGILVFSNGWITILGAMGLSYVGLYIILNGINGIKDTVYTWAWGIIILCVALYILVKSAIEMIEEINLG